MQFRRRSTDASGSGNDGHTVGVFQLVHGLFEIRTVIAFNAPTHAATPGVVRHQNNITARQGDEGGERGTFVASLLFLDLDQKFLSFANHILYASLARRDVGAEKLFGDFLEGQEAMAFFSIVNKASLQGRFHSGHNSFVDVALSLFSSFNFNFIVK